MAHIEPYLMFLQVFLLEICICDHDDEDDGDDDDDDDDGDDDDVCVPYHNITITWR